MSPGAIFVQPHLDDVALSCGGVVGAAAANGASPRVVTIFAGAPDLPAALGALATRLHARWGLGDRPLEGRKLEDRAACALLGAEPAWLAHTEALYRAGPTGPPALLRDLFARPTASDDVLLARVIDDVRAVHQAFPEATFFFPLGVGGHADHLLCQAAGAALETHGAAVVYYEDFPYVTAPGEPLRQRLTELAPDLQSRVIRVEPWFEARLAASAAYRSQLGTILGGRPLADAARGWASAVAPGGLGERLWGSATALATLTRTLGPAA